MMPIAPATPSLRGVSIVKTYGDGTIVKRLDGDKLEVQFATAGKKTLLARFVEPIA